MQSPGGFPSPALPVCPTASRQLISVEGWSSDQWTPASATGRCELSCSHFQLAAGNRVYLKVPSPEPTKETEWCGGQVGPYLGLRFTYLPGGCPVLPHSRPQFLSQNVNKYLHQNCYYRESQARSPLLSLNLGPMLPPWCYLVTRCLCWAFVFQVFLSSVQHPRTPSCS